MTRLNEYEFRPILEAELTTYQQLVRYVFAENSPIEEWQDLDSVKPEWTWCAFHHDKLVATSAGYPFKMRLNGFGIQVDGVTDVGTLPHHRRGGLVRKLMVDRLRKAYESDQLASILWASMARFTNASAMGWRRRGCLVDLTQESHNFNSKSRAEVTCLCTTVTKDFRSSRGFTASSSKMQL